MIHYISLGTLKIILKYVQNHFFNAPNKQRRILNTCDTLNDFHFEHASKYSLLLLGNKFSSKLSTFGVYRCLRAMLLLRFFPQTC